MDKQKFNKLLAESLNNIDQDADKIARISQITTQISQLEGQIAELKTQMQHELEGVVGELAVSVRKILPGVKVSLDGGRCNIGHLSHNLSFRPNITNSLWDVEDNMAGRRFRRHHGHSLALQSDVGPLASEIQETERR